MVSDHSFETARLLPLAAPLNVAVWLVVLPLKGVPLSAALRWPGIIIGPVVNGAWGIGTALLLRVFAGRRVRLEAA